MAAIKIICFLLFAAASLIGCSKKEQSEYITIGALLPLTGPSLDEGLRALNGLQLAKTEINENGGILGKKLDIIALNDRGSEHYAEHQYNILKGKGVAAIIGSSYSNVTIALAKAAEKDGIPIITPTATNPLVTMGRKNVFRTIFIDDYQAEFMAKFAYNSLEAKTALILYDVNNNSYRQTAEFFAKTFEDYGGQIAAVETYVSEKEYASILRKYASNSPDVIYCSEDYIAAAKLAETAFRMGFFVNTKILGTDSYDGLLAYIHNAKALQNVYYTTPFAIDDKDSAVTQFVKNYFATFSQMPLTGSATAYTSMYILAEAIKKAKSTEHDKVIYAMKENELTTIIGNMKFDKNNNPRANVYITQIKDGIYSTYEKLNDEDE